MSKIDTIDQQILDSARRNEGQPIANIVRPLVKPNFSEFGLRDRVYKLADRGLLRLKKVENGRVLVFLVG